MTRTTIMADEQILQKLRAISRREGISLAEAIRQALAWRVSQKPSRPRFIGAGAAGKGPHDTGRRSSTFRFEPRSWR